MDQDWRSAERGLRFWRTFSKQMDRLLFLKFCGPTWEASKRSVSSRQKAESRGKGSEARYTATAFLIRQNNCAYCRLPGLLPFAYCFLPTALLDFHIKRHY